MKHFLCALGAILLCTIGCSSDNPVKRDPVTFSFAKKYLVKGQTTQADVVQTFGAPNIITRSTSGGENWTYEKVAMESSGKAGGIGVLGGGIIGGAGLLGGGGSYGGYSEKGSSKTVTLTIYFDDKDVVSDYSVMETHF